MHFPGGGDPPPGLAQSLVNTGCWAKPDAVFAMQLQLWLDVHREMGFEAFQRLVVLEAFDPGYLETRAQALLGPSGGWHLLRDKLSAHRRLTEASLSHDTLGRLEQITAPSLIVHNGRDRITAPRLTEPVERGIRGAKGYSFPDAAHVITGSAARAELSSVILSFLRRIDPKTRSSSAERLVQPVEQGVEVVPDKRRLGGRCSHDHAWHVLAGAPTEAFVETLAPRLPERSKPHGPEAEIAEMVGNREEQRRADPVALKVRIDIEDVNLPHSDCDGLKTAV